MIDRAITRPEADERLMGMVRAIVDGVQPRRVILFGSRARGDARPDSDYDLAVELSADWSDYLEAHGQVKSALSSAQNGLSVDLHIRRPGELEKRGADPGYMDWDIVRQGIVLYPAGSDSRSLRPAQQPSDRVRERLPYESIKDWLDRIEQDLWVLEATLKAGESAAWGAAGFHAQQAAEKFLKILLVQAGIHPPRIHEIDKLIAEVRSAGYDFPAFTTECELLNRYAVAVGYPERLPIPNEGDGRAVIAAGKRIIEAARALLEA